MYICLACNGIEEKEKSCVNCGSAMVDMGKIADQFDDYTPYMDDEHIKQVDGDPHSLEQHSCLHLYQCPNCENEQQIALQEVFIT
ncbi:hypothetical protein Pryu01_01758 [Paraliobacillus ryukyuensis]|uniref:Uncharacterized protein n=1 Tax=Paraliobacillus ryukyuensis TaxID=200904 RepID=A0A366E867_9BACI|nr:hypothetical protein [Paraliobacillus ryukyuensis]RBO98275.1 hypothetical protein DES48_105126 [Paraliobacillus ryukyuensis]